MKRRFSLAGLVASITGLIVCGGLWYALNHFRRQFYNSAMEGPTAATSPYWTIVRGQDFLLWAIFSLVVIAALMFLFELAHFIAPIIFRRSSGKPASVAHKVLVVIVLAVVALVSASVYIGGRTESSLERNTRAEQNNLVPAVIVGNGRFEKSPFYTGTNLGEIAQILVGWPAEGEGASLVLVGNRGAVFLGADGVPKKEVRFSKPAYCPVELVRLDSGGNYGYLTRDQSWSEDVILFDKQGQERWGYSGGVLRGVDDSAAGDTDGDGKSRVVIGLNGYGGLVLVDQEAENVWTMPEANVWHVETLDANQDGKKEILHSDASGRLFVRDASGRIIAHYLPDHYVSDFSLTRRGVESDPSHILVPGSSEILILDAKGKTVSRLEKPPLGMSCRRTVGTPVEFSADGRYYALLENISSAKRSILLLYDGAGHIAYQEVIGDSCSGINAIRAERGVSLLVGCSDKVWQYSPPRPALKVSASHGVRSQR